MESSLNKKILTASFMVAGALAGLLITVIFQAMSAGWGLAARYLSTDFAIHIVPVIVGFATFLFFQFNKSILVWGDEVVSEIRKVVWPSSKDVTAMTIAVIVIVLISAVLLAVLDSLSVWAIQYLVAR